MDCQAYVVLVRKDTNNTDTDLHDLLGRNSCVLTMLHPASDRLNVGSDLEIEGRHLEELETVVATRIFDAYLMLFVALMLQRAPSRCLRNQ